MFTSQQLFEPLPYSMYPHQEAELEQWVADHPEYSASQLRAVVQVVNFVVTLKVMLVFRG